MNKGHFIHIKCTLKSQVLLRMKHEDLMEISESQMDFMEQRTVVFVVADNRKDWTKPF